MLGHSPPEYCLNSKLYSKRTIERNATRCQYILFTTLSQLLQCLANQDFIRQIAVSKSYIYITVYIITYRDKLMDLLKKICLFDIISMHLNNLSPLLFCHDTKRSNVTKITKPGLMWEKTQLGACLFKLGVLITRDRRVVLHQLLEISMNILLSNIICSTENV